MHDYLEHIFLFSAIGSSTKLQLNLMQQYVFGDFLVDGLFWAHDLLPHGWKSRGTTRACISVWDVVVKHIHFFLIIFILHFINKQ